jgi:hypothetical protein
MKTIDEILDSLCLKGKITEKHADQIKQILETWREEILKEYTDFLMQKHPIMMAGRGNRRAIEIFKEINKKKEK